MTADNKTYIAYYRRSTKSKANPNQQKHSIDRQREAVHNLVGFSSVILEFVEEETGRNDDRPVLKSAIDACRRNKSTLVIASISRLARNARFVCELLDGDVDFICCDMPDAGRLTLQILACVAENEVSMTRSRIKAALKVAKANGVQLGNPRIHSTAHPKARAASLKRGKQTADKYLPTIEHIKSELLQAGTNPTLKAIAARMNFLGFKSPRGGSISPVFIHRLQKSVHAQNSL